MISTLLDFLKMRRLEEFLESLELVVHDLNEKEKQELLFEIVNHYYSHDHYETYIGVFDYLLREPLNLNFNVNHKAPSFLALVVYRAPYLKLVNYFIEKGACINFVGDALAFVSEKDVEFAKMHLDGPRYQTCLDFAESELNNLITRNLHFDFVNPKPRYEVDETCKERNQLLINADEFAKLNLQKEYLKRIILTKRIIDYLKALGGKSYLSFNLKT